MRGATAVGFVFLVGLGACGSTVSNAVANAGSAESASDDAARAGPCPFQTRNWQVRVLPSMNPGQGLEMLIEGEVLADGEGRSGSFSAYPFSTAPLFEVRADDELTPPGPLGGGWGTAGVSQPYDPAFTRVVVRCRGAVLAELAVPRPN